MEFQVDNIYILSLFFLFLFISALSTALIIPFIVNLSNKYQILDFPDGRKQHKKPISRIGGISLIFGFFFTIFLSWILIKITQPTVFEFSNFSKISFVGLILIFIVGLVDDFQSISPFFRLFAQILISASLWIFDIQINNLDLSFIFSDTTLIELPKFISLILTILWITGITNAFNWIDGLDGLAAGTSLVAFSSLAIVSLSLGNYEISFIFFIISGNNIGFLLYNKYPARLLMGDGGSYFLGFSYAIYTIILLSSPVLLSRKNVASLFS